MTDTQIANDSLEVARRHSRSAMTMTKMITHSAAEFDEYAEIYDEALQQGIGVSGENRDFFAQGRIAWLARCLHQMRESPKRVMDYGCGTGISTPLLFNLVGAHTVLGTEISAKALEVAKKRYHADNTQFFLFEDYQPSAEMDLVFCAGVFHHIPLDKRKAALSYIHRALKPGGLFACWENNPWNPGTRYVMSRIPFDRDAKTLTPPEARGLLEAGGFKILQTDFLFLFPKALRWFRAIEPHISRLPLGAQYQVLCRKV